jgi:ABC-type transport system substrate-binding protein
MLLIAAAIIIVVGVAAYAVLPMITPKPPVTITYVQGVDAVTLDPQDMTDNPSENVCRHIYDNLVAFDEKLNIKPSLAQSWETSADGKIWTFHLRNDVKFQDGTPFNAKAVKASFDRVLLDKDPFLGRVLRRRSLYTVLSEVKVVDDYTVQLITKDPFGPMLPTLAHGAGGIVSYDATQKSGKDFGSQPVGTGPFKFVEWVRGERIVLQKNPNYWSAAPKIDRIVFLTVKEDATRVAMLERGEGDVVLSIPATEVTRLRSNPAITMRVDDSVRVIFMGMNTQKKPFTDMLVREALNYAVDRKAITDRILMGLGTPMDSPMGAAWGHVSGRVYEYNPDKAKALLAQAGYPNGFETTMWSPQGRYLMDRQVAEAVVGYLDKVGVKVKMQVMEWATYMNALSVPAKQANWDLFLLGWAPSTGDADWALRPVLATSMFPPDGNNDALYSNSTVDALILKGMTSTDQNVRLNAYSQVQQLVLADAPWIFLHVQQQVTGVRNRVAGVVVLAIEIVLVKDAYLT